MIHAKENAGRQIGACTSRNSDGKNTPHHGLKQRAKRLIVTLALWGLLPFPAAEWLIRRGGLRHE
jgi:hypothetical protein